MISRSSSGVYLPDQSHLMIVEVGGGTFHQPEIAASVAGRLSSDTPQPVAWSEFLAELDNRKRRADAFERAWPTAGVVNLGRSLGLTEQDAEDVSQETAVKAWHRLDGFKPWISKWSTWVYSVGKHTAYNYMRAQGRTWPTVDLDVLAEVLYVAHDFVDKSWSDAVWITIGKWKEVGGKQQAFAEAMEQNMIGSEYLFPCGKEVLSRIGASRTMAHRFFELFSDHARYQLIEGEINAARS